jgi:TPR repeat protein
LHRLRENTDEGSRLAQYLLGVMYQLNEIVPQDYAEAAKWVHRAAEQGLAVAQFVLGENLRARARVNVNLELSRSGNGVRKISATGWAS